MRDLLFHKTKLDGLIKIESLKKIDERGFFEIKFCFNLFKKNSLITNFVQINHSYTKKKNTIRGMHFQKGKSAEVKVVTCLKGAIWDCVVDLRKNSKSFLKYHSQILSEKNSYSLYIPEGFAHGFQSITDDTHLIYLHSTFYNKKKECRISPLDSLLQIKWPNKVSIISNKDKLSNFSMKKFEGL